MSDILNIGDFIVVNSLVPKCIYCKITSICNLGYFLSTDSDMIDYVPFRDSKLHPDNEILKVMYG